MELETTYWISRIIVTWRQLHFIGVVAEVQTSPLQQRLQSPSFVADDPGHNPAAIRSSVLTTVPHVLLLWYWSALTLTNHMLLGRNMFLAMKPIWSAGAMTCKCKWLTIWNGGQWNPKRRCTWVGSPIVASWFNFSAKTWLPTSTIRSSKRICDGTMALASRMCSLVTTKKWYFVAGLMSSNTTNSSSYKSYKGLSIKPQLLFLKYITWKMIGLLSFPSKIRQKVHLSRSTGPIKSAAPFGRFGKPFGRFGIFGMLGILGMCPLLVLQIWIIIKQTIFSI